MPPLDNARQFEMLHEELKPGQGFGIHVRSGQHVKEGWMVPLAGLDRHSPAKESGPENIQNFTNRFKPILQQRGKFLMGLHNEHEGTHQLAAARLYTDHNRAVQAMWANDQPAMLNLNRNQVEHNQIRRGAEGKRPLSPMGQKDMQTLQAKLVSERPANL